VTLNKKENATVLARTLTQRIAAYHLAAGNVKDQAIIEQLHELHRMTEHLNGPTKYQMAHIDIPEYVARGAGQEHAPTEAPSRLLGVNVDAHADPSLPPQKLRFNPPPNWPTPPPGWTPWAGWQPDPSWPPPPPGWDLWVSPAAPPRSVDPQ
jgi:hypothetical protein